MKPVPSHLENFNTVQAVFLHRSNLLKDKRVYIEATVPSNSKYDTRFQTYLVMCEVSHQPDLNVWVVGDATQNLGALEGGLWV